jgi:type IV pilus assembly protein PilC
MATFTYTAVDSKGNKSSGSIDAGSREDAVNKIHAQGLFPQEVKAQGGDFASQAAAGQTYGKVKAAKLAEFTVNLSTLQDAGLPIVRSLKILENQLEPGPLKKTVAVVAEDVESGSTFSEALAKHPRIFDNLYVNMIKAGEIGGVLDVILRRLAEFMEKAEHLKKKIASASMYPITVISVATLILVGIMIFVIPTFQNMFLEMGLDLPIPTQILLGVSEFLQNFWYLIPGLPFAYILGYRLTNSTPAGKYASDKVKLIVPVFGIITSKSIVARFTRTMGTLLSSGVPILEALAIVKNAIGNAVLQRAVEAVYESIREGESMAAPLGHSGLFDDMVVNMIDVGEETGELDKMLIKIADNYDSDVDGLVEGMMSMIEPLLIVGLGGSIGFIVVALFLPLITLIQTMGQQ